MTNLPHSCADKLKIRGAPGPVQACNMIAVSFYVQENITKFKSLAE